MRYTFNKELYSKTALLKACYNYTDRAYVHLDADKDHYYVDLIIKSDASPISEFEFINEMLVQSIRHEVYLQTKNIRELMLARAMATTVIGDIEEGNEDDIPQNGFIEDEILKDWFSRT